MRLREAAETARSTADRAGTRSKRGFVYFITSGRNIQAVKTAAAFGIIAQAVQAVAETAAIFIPVRVTVPMVALVLMVVVFWVADYADANTDEWRSLVEEKTGEMAADDDADGEEGDGGP